jgi:hypothetical protein
MGTEDAGNGKVTLDKTETGQLVVTARDYNSRVDFFLFHVLEEVRRARAKFPDPSNLTVAFAEEAGEVVKAVMGEPWENVYNEAVQAAAMACRLALEGDPLQAGYRAKYAKETT